MRCTLSLVLCCFGALHGAAIAQEVNGQPTQYLVDHYSRKDGLPSDRVWVAREGPRGYLWIGTGAGLVRFDGLKFTVFNATTHEAFDANDVRDLEWTPSGDLWIATYGGGALRMRNGEFRHFNTKDGLAGDIVYSIYRASDGSIWFATDNGVSQLDGTELKSWSMGDDSGSQRVLKITEGRDGTIWFSSLTDGLSYFDGTAVRRDVTGLDSPQVHMLKADSRLGVIAATATGQVFTSSGGARFEPIALDLGAPIEEFLSDRQGFGWAGTYGNGLWRLEGDQAPKRFDLEVDGSSTDIVLDVHEDRNGSLWVATPRGLAVLRETPFLALASREGLDDSTFVVAGDSSGTMWVGTERRGLFRVSTDGTIDQPVAALSALPVSALHVARDGVLWVGTFGGGLYAASNGDLRHYDEEQGLSGVHIFALNETSDGNVWVATDTGLDVLDATNDRIEAAGATLDGALVRHITVGRDGRLWLSSNKGLFELAGGVTRQWTKDDGLRSALVNATYEDERGVLWISSSDGGLARLWQSQLFAFGREHGLNQLSAFAVLEDHARNLWVSNVAGLLRISRDSLDAVALGERSKVEFRLFNEADGLRSTQFVGGFQNAAWATPDNKMWFASARGVASFNPDSLAGEEPALRSYIEAVRVDGRAVSADNLLNLPANLRTLEIDYSAPELGNPGSVSFRYAMGEYSGAWQEVGGRRTAYFTALPAGEGVFRVQARFGDRPFASDDADVATLRVKRAAHWYETTLAPLLALLFLIAFVALLQKQLSRRARNRERELIELVDRRTEELQEALERVQANARIDSLTGVANRRHMEEQLAAVWKMASRNSVSVGLIMLDIDRFKQYNDSLGHNAGDDCLRRIAHAVKGKLLREHDMLARYGGEEFLILLYDSDRDGVSAAADRILEGVRLLEIPHPDSDIASFVTVSLGCAITPKVRDTDDPHVLVKAADEALYAAKNAGRNRARMAPALNPAVAETVAENQE